MTLFLLKLRPMAFLLLLVVVLFFVVAVCCCCCCRSLFVCGLYVFVCCCWGFCLFVIAVVVVLCLFVLLGFVFYMLKYRSVIAEKFINEEISFRRPEVRSCMKVEVAVLGSPSLTVLMVSVDVKQH